MSIEQEELVADHLLRKKELYMAPDERARLINWVARRHPGHIIKAGEMDLENCRWTLELQQVTVTD